MTIYEKIKSLDEDEMIKFLLFVEYNFPVVKRYSCDTLFCEDCENDFICYREYLNQEYTENIEEE